MLQATNQFLCPHLTGTEWFPVLLLVSCPHTHLFSTHSFDLLPLTEILDLVSITAWENISENVWNRNRESLTNLNCLLIKMQTESKTAFTALLPQNHRPKFHSKCGVNLQRFKDLFEVDRSNRKMHEYSKTYFQNNSPRQTITPWNTSYINGNMGIPMHAFCQHVSIVAMQTHKTCGFNSETYLVKFLTQVTAGAPVKADKVEEQWRGR